MKIAVIGTGFVGLTTGACLADLGHSVTCADADPAKIASLRSGRMPFHEPGLEDVVRRCVLGGRLAFCEDTGEAVAGSDVVFLCVGTPSSPNGAADLRYVLAAARAIGRGLTGYAVVATKSTVPAGTCAVIRNAVERETVHPFATASNPEFLKEGDAVRDFMKPDRVVIGTENARAMETLRTLYEPLVRTSGQILCMSTRSAEVAKYASNAMLATRISLMNEIAEICDKVGADVTEVRHAVGADARVGSAFLYAGVGFGGSCFGKDLRELSATGRALGVPTGIADAVLARNARQRVLLVERVREHFRNAKETAQEGAFSAELVEKTVAVWGISFKPETDDVREAPAVEIISYLTRLGCRVRTYDPAVRPAEMPYTTPCGSVYEAARDADALLLVTEWREFRRPDFGRLKSIMREPVVFDGRNVWDPAELRALGFTYYGVGRP